MMVSDEKLQEEIDNATELLMKVDLIQTYATMLRIRHSSDMKKELDNELKCLEIKLKYMDIDSSSLKNIFLRQNESYSKVQVSYGNHMISRRNCPSCTLKINVLTYGLQSRRCNYGKVEKHCILKA